LIFKDSFSQGEFIMLTSATASIPIRLEGAYSWLYEFDESCLRPAATQLYMRMRTAVNNSNMNIGWLKLNELKDFSTTSNDDCEIVEILIHCGWAAFQMNNNAEAIQLLREAFSRAATDRHRKAIAGWMLGYILWLRPYPAMSPAISAWESSIEQFDILARSRRLGSAAASWYRDRWHEMQESLISAIDSNGISPIPGRETVPPAISVSSPIYSFPVLGEISAGEMYNTMEANGNLEIREVFIGDDGPYRPISLRAGERIINIPQSREYYVLRVRGTSMNAAIPAPILDGDYVLMRAQNTAQNGDIVAAEIVGVDSRSTLKRYSLENGRFVLMPESNDPSFQTPISIRREFTKLDNEFFIRGIAQAVLRRVED
jgi:SOS-response transcriptional repressor LexA